MAALSLGWKDIEDVKLFSLPTPVKCLYSLVKTISRMVSVLLEQEEGKGGESVPVGMQALCFKEHILFCKM